MEVKVCICGFINYLLFKRILVFARFFYRRYMRERETLGFEYFSAALIFEESYKVKAYLLGDMYFHNPVVLLRVNFHYSERFTASYY